MKDSRLLSVLNTLGKSEWRELRQFAQSPYFNTRADVCALLDYLSGCLLELRIVPSKEQVFRRVYRGKVYDAQQTRQLMSWGMKLVETWLTCRESLRNPVKTNLLLAEAYREKQLSELFELTMKKTRQLHENQSPREGDWFETGYQIEQAWYRYTATGQRTSSQNLQQLSDQSDYAFIIRKLRHTCLSLSHQTVYKTDYRYGLLAEVLGYIEREGLLTEPAIAAYYYCYQAMTQTEENAASFLQFKNLIFEHRQVFPEEEWRDLLLLALNYCIKKLNQGDAVFAVEGLVLYKEGLNTGLLLVNGQLSRFAYRNMVAIGLKVGELAWVEQFIHQYKTALPKEHRESMFSFSLAKLAYARRDYASALGLLQKAEYADLLLNLAAKTLLMKMFYETGAFDLLAAHLQAMKAFIRRKGVIGYHQDNYLNIIHFAHKLMDMNPFDKSGKETLQQAIENEEVLTEKAWLLEQIG